MERLSGGRLSTLKILVAALTTVVSALGAQASAASAAEAPGAPGASANWTTGNKQGLGTATSRASKVWYTLSDGSLSEVYFPSGDRANVRSLEFAVTDGSTFVDRESADTVHAVRLDDQRSLTYTQVNTAKSGRYRITKTYVTDPARDTVLMRVTFEPLVPGDYRLFALYDPALGNSSLHDTGSRRGVGTDVALLAADGAVASALVSSSGFARASSGFVGTSDGWTDLVADRSLDFDYDTATDGNILQTGEVALNAGAATTFTLALGFGDSTTVAEASARASLVPSFDDRRAAYQQGWHDYLDSLAPVPAALAGRLATQYEVSVMTVKAHEDKTYPGAFIASLTLPWGFAVNADEGGGGYHFVWARDLYQQASALLAAGDRAAADRAVTWLFTHQQLPDGTFPQNSRVDGTPDQRNLQLDEVAFPIVLAWQLGRTDDATFAGVRKAAEAIVAHGPSTPQERWEETGGFSPSTTAAETAGLATAADLARQRGEDGLANLWLGVADAWQRSTERWMFTTTGPLGDGRYYVRIDDNGDPNDGSERDFANGAGVHKENAVVDGGFLDLVRLGVKAPGDPYVAGSLAENDASLATDTPSGRVWHRYTFDGYGEQPDGSPWTFGAPGTKGRAWPLLGGERGEYEVARSGDGSAGVPFLQTMANTANDGFMIPEQAWDQPQPAPAPYNYQPGKATGTASPLSWAMAQYVRLARAVDAGHPVETPAAVADRYARGDQRRVPALEVTSPRDGSVADRRQVTVRGTTDGDRVYVGVGDAVTSTTPQGGAFTIDVPLQRGGNRITVVAVGADGGTNMRQVTVVAFGTRVGGFADPAGDDNGPGTYTYPTNSAFAPGGFDIRNLDVFTDGDQVLFVTRINGEVRNPWGGDQISHQRINIYLGTGPGQPQAALPGTNMDTAAPWSAVVVADGRFKTAGVYAADGSKTSDIQLLAVPQTRQIAAVVPRSALGDLDLTKARFGVAMFGNAEAGEGIGNVRPVYDFDYWNNPPDGMGWVKEYRFGGGAGQVDFNLPSKDTDTRDPNSIDVIVGCHEQQAQVLDWRAASPVQLPMVRMNSAPTVNPSATPASGSAPLRVALNARAVDSDGDAVTYAWDFGDGTGASTANPSHVYTRAGTYTATVTVSDTHCGQTSGSVQVTVGEPDHPGTTPPGPPAQNPGPHPKPLGKVLSVTAGRRCYRDAVMGAAPTGSRRAMRFTYRLSAAAPVRIALRRRNGSPAWRFCPRRRRWRGGHPSTYTPVGSRTEHGHSGANPATIGAAAARFTGLPAAITRKQRSTSGTVSIAQLLRKRHLRPGTYVLEVASLDASGHVSSKKSVKFWVYVPR